MGFNGEVLVGRGDAFADALEQFWNRQEEVISEWRLRDDWLAFHVRTPTFGDELVEFAEAVGGPVLACWVFESDVGRIRGISDAGQWGAWLNPDHAAYLEMATELEAKRPAAVAAAVAWAAQSGLEADAARIEEILAAPWKPWAQHGFFALLPALGLADPEIVGE